MSGAKIRRNNEKYDNRIYIKEKRFAAIAVVSGFAVGADNQ
jgi:hypothetical protein